MSACGYIVGFASHLTSIGDAKEGGQPPQPEPHAGEDLRRRQLGEKFQPSSFETASPPVAMSPIVTAIIAAEISSSSVGSDFTGGGGIGGGGGASGSW